MIQILDFVKQVGQICLQEAHVVVDGTLGNGHDALWLRENAPQAQIYGFDIQQEAINNTQKRLIDAGVDMSKIELIHDSHAMMDHYLQHEIDFLLFNFGYLPGGDKTITTKTKTSLQAIEKGLEMLACKGVAILVVYPGHAEGEKEAEAVRDLLTKLAWEQYHVYCYQIINNTKKPPIAYIIQKAVQ